MTGKRVPSDREARRVVGADSSVSSSGDDQCSNLRQRPLAAFRHNSEINGGCREVWASALYLYLPDDIWNSYGSFYILKLPIVANSIGL